MSPQQQAQLRAENEHLLNTMEEEPIEEYVEPNDELFDATFGNPDGNYTDSTDDTGFDWTRSEPAEVQP